MIDWKHLDEVLGFLIVFIQAYAIYLCIKMKMFASRYSKSWARAWTAMLSIMILAFIRRGLVIAFGFGLDGMVGKILKWGTDYIVNLTISILWVVFLTLLLKWWNVFFDTYSNGEQKLLDREKEVIRREEEVSKREKLIVENPNGVEVNEPKKVIVDVADKKVFAEAPKKVIIINPKDIREIKE